MASTSIPIEKAKNLGPLTGAELRAVGIESVQQLQALGWEKAFESWVNVFPERVNLNALYALIGAVEELDWREIPADQKQEAKDFIRGFRR